MLELFKRPDQLENAKSVKTRGAVDRKEMGLYVIVSGNCIVVNEALPKKVFATIGRGDMFGESSATKAPVSAFWL